MNNKFEKNKLDLAYQRQLCYLNIVLLLGTIGLLSFIGTFIWKRDFLFYGVVISISVTLISIFWHYKIDNNLKNISNEIKNLSPPKHLKSRFRKYL